MNREKFFVLIDQPTLAVLEFTEDKLIAAEFERSCRTFSGRVVVIPFSSEVTVTKKAIGPLKPGPCENDGQASEPASKING